MMYWTKPSTASALLASFACFGTSKNVRPEMGSAAGADAGAFTIGVRTSFDSSPEKASISSTRSSSRRTDVFPRRVLYLRDWKMVLLGISQLDISDSAGTLLNHSGHAFAPFAADPEGPAYGEALADLAFPFGVDGGKIGCE